MTRNSRILLVAVIAGATFVLAPGAHAMPGSKKACKSSFVNASSIPSTSQDQAKLDARLKWTAKVASMLGPAWADWLQAAQKSYNCKKVSPHAWRCVASARPCGQQRLIHGYEPRREFDLPRFRTPRRPGPGIIDLRPLPGTGMLRRMPLRGAPR